MNIFLLRQLAPIFVGLTVFSWHNFPSSFSVFPAFSVSMSFFLDAVKFFKCSSYKCGIFCPFFRPIRAPLATPKKGRGTSWGTTKRVKAAQETHTLTHLQRLWCVLNVGAKLKLRFNGKKNSQFWGSVSKKHM